MTNYLKLSDFYPGQMVTYCPEYGKKQIGVVKDVGEKVVFVVYNCNEEWDIYWQYTAAGTLPEHLVIGWVK